MTKHNLRINVLRYLVDNGGSQSDICKGAGITQATMANALNKEDRKPCLNTVHKVKTFLESKGHKWID